jgi:hypothetical protein
MSDDDIIIIEPTPKPTVISKPQPLIATDPGRTYGEMTPQQKARVRRSQNGPFFFEPIFGQFGPTRQWRVGRVIGSEERTIAEFDNKEQAMSCFAKHVSEFFGRG